MKKKKEKKKVHFKVSASKSSIEHGAEKKRLKTDGDKKYSRQKKLNLDHKKTKNGKIHVPTFSKRKKLKHVKHKYTNTLCIYAHHQPRLG